jgi:hypothetical protein
MKQNRREALTALLGGMAGAACRTETPRIQPMKEIPATSRFTAAEESGWYLSVAGIAEAKGNLIVTYRRSDAHRASDSYIMTARSEDGGRTWKDHRPIHHLSWENNRACWVAPQLTALRDGRLVLVADRGEKLNKDDWPMLSRWQQKPLGMSNHLFWSHDGGQSWDGPHQIDDWGGEPGYILELADGTLVYTRTEAQRTEKLLNPLPQWGEFYYRNTAVFSDDGGKTWKRTAVVADDPYYSDCEVGLAEYAPGKLLAATRCGDAGSQFGQPSRLVYSSDSGRTWGKPKLAPFYGHRVIVGKLQSGKLLAVFRNAWGTSASYAFVFDAEENFDYQPNSWIWDEARCRLRDGAMELDTADGPRGAAEFTLYPCESLRSPVEIEAELAVGEAAPRRARSAPAAGSASVPTASNWPIVPSRASRWTPRGFIATGWCAKAANSPSWPMGRRSWKRRRKGLPCGMSVSETAIQPAVRAPGGNARTAGSPGGGRFRRACAIRTITPSSGRGGRRADFRTNSAATASSCWSATAASPTGTTDTPIGSSKATGPFWSPTTRVANRPASARSCASIGSPKRRCARERFRHAPLLQSPGAHAVCPGRIFGNQNPSPGRPLPDRWRKGNRSREGGASPVGRRE